MGLGIEDRVIHVERIGRGKQQIEIFQGFGEEKTRHAVCGLLVLHAAQRGIACVGSAKAQQAIEKNMAHGAIARIVRIEVQVICRFNDLGP